MDLAIQLSGAVLTSGIYSFTGGADGDFPGTTLVIDKAGNLYGTSNTSPFGGVVFKFTP